MLTDKQLFLFDIDGTLCLGDTWIDGARELLALLKAQGKHYLFLTNNSTKSQLDYVEKFQKMGLTVDKEEILTASMATGILLRDLYPNRKFYALGTRSFEEEMRSYGVELTTDPAEAEGLLAAYDAELTYGKLVDACHILQRAELPFIATNPDLVCPDEVGFVPDCGSICQMLENATGRKPRYVGKPSSFMVKYALQKQKMHKSQAVFVGDRMYTDILCGVKAGVDTIAVLTGEVQEKDLLQYEYQPIYVYPSVKEVYKDLTRGLPGDVANLYKRAVG